MRKLLVIVLLLAAVAAQAQENDSLDIRTAFPDPVEGASIIAMSDAKFQGEDWSKTFPKWVAKHVTYPVEARQSGIRGTVFARFIVSTDGTLSDIRIIKSPNDLLSQEVRFVLRRSPKWEPARQGFLRCVDGKWVDETKEVRSQIEIPITFGM